MTSLPVGLQKRGTSYYVQHRRSGQWRQVSVGKDLGVALQKHEELRTGTDPFAVKLNELVERWQKRHATYSKKSTQLNAKSDGGKLIRFFGKRLAEALTPEDLELYIGHRAETVSTNTINRELRALRAILRLAVEEKRIASMPFKVRELPVTKRVVDIFTREQVATLIKAADPRTRALIMIAAATGMRRSEILHLKWRDIRGGEIRVTPKPEADWEPKTYEERNAFVSPAVVTYLAEYRATLECGGADDWIFQPHRHPGERLADTSKALRNAFKAAGLYRKGDLLHVLRHAVCSTLLAEGTDLHTVMEIMGHASLATTQGYLHSRDELKRAASKRSLV